MFPSVSLSLEGRSSERALHLWVKEHFTLLYNVPWGNFCVMSRSMV